MYLRTIVWIVKIWAYIRPLLGIYIQTGVFVLLVHVCTCVLQAGSSKSALFAQEYGLPG